MRYYVSANYTSQDCLQTISSGFGLSAQAGSDYGEEKPFMEPR